MIIVRTAHEADLAPLVAIGLRAWEQAVSGIADVKAMRGVAEHGFLVFLRAHWSTTSVIEQDGAMLGWAAREDGDGLITDLWIEPSAQRRGLGSALLAEVEERIVSGGFDTAAAATHARNAPAISFFRKHGYSVSWLSTAYSAKLDRDVESVGLSKILVAEEPEAYGPGLSM